MLKKFPLKPALLAAGLAALGVTLAQATLVATYSLPGKNTFPEGVAYDPASGALFTGSSANGTIYRVNPATGDVGVFSLGGSPGRTSALGMKVDRYGRLFVAGGATGQLTVHDTGSGVMIKRYETNPSPQAYLNDMTVASDGYVYVTDSTRPVLYRVRTTPTALGSIESWLDLTRTPVRYEEGVNLNGIVASPDGRILVAVQLNTGQLWRIDARTKAVSEVDLGGAKLVNGDGLVLAGRTLHVVRNENRQVAQVELSSDYRSGRLVGSFSSESFDFPTTAALAGNRLFVVNSQLNRSKSQGQKVPFTISSVEVPPASAATRAATAVLRDRAGKRVGTVRLAATGNGVRLSLQVAGLPPGVHAMHVHENWVCAASRNAAGAVVPFEAAGAHYDPYGTENHAGPTNPPSEAHAGDLPNVTVGANGAGSLSATTTKLALAPGPRSALGRAIILHARADDYKTDPAGESGGRIACGVVEAGN